jgi:hypothetical protein
MEETKRTTLTRQELYDRVWATPMSKLCREFGLSDVGLAKICKAHEVPYPPPGYWAKVHSGVPARKLPLKPASDPALDEVRIRGRAAPEPPAAAREAAEAGAAAERQAENRIEVAATLADPLPLVERTARNLTAAKPGPDGRVRPRAGRCLDVEVSPAQVDRAARLLDALVKALEARGYPVSVGDEERPKTWVTVLGERMSVRLEEGLEHRERVESFFDRRHKHDSVPNGKLVLRIDDTLGWGYRRQWSDGKKALDGMLNSVVAGLVKAAETSVGLREENARREREAKEAERRRREAEERQRQEAARVQDFNDKLAAWEQAERVRAFVAAVRADAARRGVAVEPGGELDRWLAWAARRADRVDPLAATEPGRRWPPPAGYRVKLADQHRFGWSGYDYDGTPIAPPDPPRPAGGSGGG